ncbi:MAG TPA: hypothetical protein VIE68_03280 [Gemmatimonadota bacterium]|jgi:hypothetical protein
MTRYACAFLLALALSAACSRPNLESTGGGYAPAPAAAADDQAGTATPR